MPRRREDKREETNQLSVFSSSFFLSRLRGIFTIRSTLPAIGRSFSELLPGLGHRRLVVRARLLPRVGAERHAAIALALARVLAGVLAAATLALAIVVALATVLLRRRT